MIPSILSLTDDARLVLRAVAYQDMDGYTLTSKTALSSDRLEKAVNELAGSGLLRVKGALRGDNLLRSWFQSAVPPSDLS